MTAAAITKNARIRYVRENSHAYGLEGVVRCKTSPTRCKVELTRADGTKCMMTCPVASLEVVA
jgi:hypothetical protein